ncbi:hypothetical protein RAB80_007757 [Fusarium oxysporum f. sp. vasinfectum]|nr:hypothetical protein RAB80_007757 [Fusarium oxysporum f. sp. vasinfectum]
MPALPPSSTIPSGHNPLSVRQNDDSSSSFTAVPTAYKSADNSLAPACRRRYRPRLRRWLSSPAVHHLHASTPRPSRENSRRRIDRCFRRAYEYRHGRYVDISKFPKQKGPKNEE